MPRLMTINTEGGKCQGYTQLRWTLQDPSNKRAVTRSFDDYKYVMVAASRCPREYMSASATPEYEKELYVPDEPDEPESDPLELEEEAGLEDKSSGGEESEGEMLGPETLDDAVEKLSSGEDIYITRPLRRRTAQHVRQAAKEILLQLRQSGLHVDVIHTDRVREFKAKTGQGMDSGL